MKSHSACSSNAKHRTTVYMNHNQAFQKWQPPFRPGRLHVPACSSQGSSRFGGRAAPSWSSMVIFLAISKQDNVFGKKSEDRTPDKRNPKPLAVSIQGHYGDVNWSSKLKSLRTSSDSSSKASEKAKAPKEVMFRFTAAILWQNVRLVLSWISGQILCLKQQILESGHCQQAFSPSNSKWWTFWSHFLIRQLTWHLKICFKFGEVQVKCKWRV